MEYARAPRASKKRRHSKISSTWTTAELFLDLFHASYEVDSNNSDGELHILQTISLDILLENAPADAARHPVMQFPAPESL